MFGMGMPEILLILAIALIVIGPKKLPDLAKSMGRAMREFKKATSELKESMEIDADMGDVKKAFNDMSEDIKESVDLTGSYKKSAKEPAADSGDKKSAKEPAADSGDKKSAEAPATDSGDKKKPEQTPKKPPQDTEPPPAEGPTHDG